MLINVLVVKPAIKFVRKTTSKYLTKRPLLEIIALFALDVCIFAHFKQLIYLANISERTFNTITLKFH